MVPGLVDPHLEAKQQRRSYPECELDLLEVLADHRSVQVPQLLSQQP